MTSLLDKLTELEEKAKKATDDGGYIAVCDPQTILSLCEKLRELEKENALLRQALEKSLQLDPEVTS